MRACARTAAPRSRAAPAAGPRAARVRPTAASRRAVRDPAAGTGRSSRAAGSRPGRPPRSGSSRQARRSARAPPRAGRRARRSGSAAATGTRPPPSRCARSGRRGCPRARSASPRRPGCAPVRSLAPPLGTPPHRERYLGDGMSAQQRAREFVDDVLIPRELDAELGRLTAGDVATIRREALARRVSGGLHRVEHGGQGWSHEEWFLVEEQFGRSTNALSWHVPSAYNVLASGTPEQIERYLKPALRGELHDAYAVTEERAGSDPSAIRTEAARTDGGWRISGEKWFVTYGDVAAVYIVMALAEGAPTLFLVVRSAGGVSVVGGAPFTR